ncbi:hypothetical protein BJV82DRAFT_579321 [Fennellomyces sp. T-0311]|nr:hypothetical protein BJV82DRAFT_579321 [Fennellomyces sp. T-0311]
MDTNSNCDQAIEAYINEKTGRNEQVSLAQFIDDNFELVAQYTEDNQWESLEHVWSARFNAAARRLDVNVASHVSDPSDSPSATPISSSIASKEESCQLTHEAKAEFEQKFKAMKDDKKWKLRDGVYVEDVMYKFGMKSTHEHPVHSFILNVSDKCWEECSDFTAEDLNTIRTFGNYAFPAISDNLKDILENFRSRGNFHFAL